jgi:pimeloyl-ACP methyl ester carboxylesterase
MNLSVLCARTAACAAAALLLGMPGPLAAASAPAKPEPPRVLRTPAGLTEVGLLDGAAYRIDVPEDWNHSLVVFYHGYAEHPAPFHIAERLSGQQEPFFDRHFAVVQSAYSQTGWALAQAYPETDALRRYFIKKYGQPRDTYVVGFSMGGLLTSITLELNPKPYAGGLDVCGSVGPTFEAFERRFAMRAAFDHYFPDLLPPLLATPPVFDDTPALHDKLLAALRAEPAAATSLRNLMGLHTDADVAHDIGYFTYVVGDLQHRAGGNPFDNRNFIYTGTNPTSAAADFELNDKVRRYAANPQARQYLMHHYTPSGHLGRPMLAVHTVYDPIVPAASISLYNHMVEAAGAGENLVQQYVDREGHCNVTNEQIGTAFDELQRWTHGGARPTPGLLKESAARAPTAP